MGLTSPVDSFKHERLRAIEDLVMKYSSGNGETFYGNIMQSSMLCLNRDISILVNGENFCAAAVSM